MAVLRSLPSAVFSGMAIVVAVESHGAELTVSIDVHGRSVERSKIHFESLVGYRVLDERDLPQSWHASQNEGVLEDCILYEVASGGWADDHKRQSEIMAAGVYPRMREWIVLSDDWCVSVLSEASKEPDISSR